MTKDIVSINHNLNVERCSTGPCEECKTPILFYDKGMLLGALTQGKMQIDCDACVSGFGYVYPEIWAYLVEAECNRANYQEKVAKRKARSAKLLDLELRAAKLEIEHNWEEEPILTSEHADSQGKLCDECSHPLEFTIEGWVVPCSGICCINIARPQHWRRIFNLEKKRVNKLEQENSKLKTSI